MKYMPARMSRVAVVALSFVIILIAALTFFPALLLGPVVQALTPQLF